MYSFQTFIFYTDRANSPLKIILREGKERFFVKRTHILDYNGEFGWTVYLVYSQGWIWKRG